MSADFPALLRALSEALQHLHGEILAVERKFDPSLAGLAGMDRLTRDPAWAWLRAVSSLIAEVDHVLASREPISEYEVAAVGAHARALVFGTGEPVETEFLARYRPLLQMSVELVGAHGQLKRVLDTFPAEASNESERLHARHVWSERCKHGGRCRV